MSASVPGAASSAPIDLNLVRRLFSRPEHVRESDFLRREVANRMHERLALIKIQPKRLLDAGCGEGADLGVLQQQYQQAQVVGLDASLPMLQSARARQLLAQSSMQRLLTKWLPTGLSGSVATPPLIAGDFAALPLATNSLDLIWSNLALHWHAQPDVVFAEWRRALAVDGLLMFSCFGPDTFKELRAAFAQTEADLPMLPFVDMHDLGDMLVHAGFATPVMDMELITVTYDTVEKLLADVRAWGGNPLATRRRALLGRRAWSMAMQALENQRSKDGKLRLSFEVVYGHAFRPIPRTTATGEAIVRFNPPRK